MRNSYRSVAFPLLDDVLIHTHLPELVLDDRELHAMLLALQDVVPYIS